MLQKLCCCNIKKTLFLSPDPFPKDKIFLAYFKSINNIRLILLIEHFAIKAPCFTMLEQCHTLAWTRRKNNIFSAIYKTMAVKLIYCSFLLMNSGCPIFFFQSLFRTYTVVIE